MRTFLVVVAAGLIGVGAPGVVISAAIAQDVEGLARSLAATPKPAEPAACPKKLPDGSCPDQVDTRQMRLPGAASIGAATSRLASSAVSAIRSDISMTFVKGSSDLTAAAKATLDRFAHALTAASTYRAFTVEGHTDRSGSREINQALSQARAESVVHYLTANGVDKARMTAKGFGFDKTLKGHAPEDAANRRVEVSAS